MPNELRHPIDRNVIPAKLVELIRLAAEHGIDIQIADLRGP